MSRPPVFGETRTIGPVGRPPRPVGSPGPTSAVRALGQTQVHSNKQVFTARLPIKEFERVQLGPGAEEYRSQRFCGRDLVLVCYTLLPRIAIRCLPQEDWVFLITQLRCKSDLVFNGQPAGRYDLFVAAGRNGYMTTGANRFHAAVGIRRSRLAAACAALAGIGREDVKLRDCTVSMNPQLGRRLHESLVQVAGCSDLAAKPEEPFMTPSALENDLVSALAAGLLPHACGNRQTRHYGINEMRVVRRAMAASRSLSAPGLADLCEATGVSQRWLNKCFARVLGVSPYRFVRNARLTRAHDLLLHSSESDTLVKCVSLEFGYRLSGRFANEYRSLFGENPSDTLRRQP